MFMPGAYLHARSLSNRFGAGAPGRAARAVRDARLALFNKRAKTRPGCTLVIAAWQVRPLESSPAGRVRPPAAPRNAQRVPTITRRMS